VLTNWVLDGFRVDPRPLFHSSQAQIEGSANRSSYASREADSLMDRAAVTLDPADATGLWRDFARVIQRDQPITMLFWNDELIAYRREVVPAALDARGELATLPRWRWRTDGGPR
jgi:ABC-type transport system substrate-binding protein